MGERIVNIFSKYFVKNNFKNKYNHQLPGLLSVFPNPVFLQ